MADPSDFWFAVWMLVVAVAGGGWFAFRWLHVARMIEDTPTSRIRSAAQGYVELAGRCSTLDGSVNLAPLTQRPCVWWRYRIQRRTGSTSRAGRRRSWQTVSAGRSEQPFMLDDGTAQCIVQPSGAEVLTGESTTWHGDTPWPTQVPGHGLAGAMFGEREYRYFEERIYEHEQVCILGGFRTHAGVGHRDPQAEVAALLAEWKQDQARLVERFDTDDDGHVSLAEWERAREEARQAVVQRGLDEPLQPALHSIGRPEGGRLFLVAAFAEADVARRYRRRAIAAFASFAAATYALGWLLQDVFG